MGHYRDDRYDRSRSRDSNDRHRSRTKDHHYSDHSRRYNDRSSSYEANRNRSCDREQSYSHEENYDTEGGNHGSYKNREIELQVQHNSPSNILCIKNMSFEATEAMIWEEFKVDKVKMVRMISNKDVGKPRGLAFCTFPSIVDATNVISKYPTSSGYGPGPALIFIGQVCVIEYATSSEPRQDKRADWVCERCFSVNQMRRNECRGCKNSRSDACLDIDRALFECGHSSSSHILVKGLCLSATEADIMQSFSNFAPTKSAYIFRDNYSSFSRGYALVEFETLDGATNVIAFKGYFSVCGYQVTIGYANQFSIREAHNSISISHNITLQQKPKQQSIYESTLFMSPYGMSGMMPYSTPSYNPFQQSIYIQQQIIEKTEEKQQSSITPTNIVIPSSRRKGESLIALQKKLPDGRLFPHDYLTDSLSFIFDPHSGYYYEMESQFYYCVSQQLYLDAITGDYYTHDNEQLKSFVPLPPTQSSVNLPSSSSSSSLPSSVSIPLPSSSLPSSSLPSSSSSSLIPSLTNFQFTPSVTVASVTPTHPLVLKFVKPLEEEEKKEEEKIENSLQGLKPGQTVDLEMKMRVRQNSEVKKERVLIPSLLQIERVTGVLKSGHSACYVCGRRLIDDNQLKRHVSESTLHQRQMKEWLKYHGEMVTDYKDRAEERRKTVGSTVIGNSNKPGYQPSPQSVPGYQSITQSVSQSVPGQSIPVSGYQSVPVIDQSSSSIGQVLLAKDGWLKKHQDDDLITQTTIRSNQRVGLGYNDSTQAINQDINSTRRTLMKQTQQRIHSLLIVS